MFGQKLLVLILFQPSEKCRLQAKIVECTLLNQIKIIFTSLPQPALQQVESELEQPLPVEPQRSHKPTAALGKAPSPQSKNCILFTFFLK